MFMILKNYGNYHLGQEKAIYMLVSTIELGEFIYDFKQALAPLCISSNGGVCSNVITKVRKKPLCFTKLIKLKVS